MPKEDGCFYCSAPGSVMLMGEHAVLHGYPAVVAAIDQRIRVKLTPRLDRKVHIDSALGQYDGEIGKVGISNPFQFVLTAIECMQSQLPAGFDLSIESDFQHHLGLGSSAAVTVSVLTVLFRYCRQLIDKKLLIEQAVGVIRHVQGRGSGADIAASVLGGIVCYEAETVHCQQLAKGFPEISLVYCGHKVSTADILQQMRKREQVDPQRDQVIYQQMGDAAVLAWQAICQQNTSLLAQQFVQHQRCMQRLELSEPILDSLIEQASALDAIAAAKISGAGLGDCILSLGYLPNAYFPIDEQQKKLGVQQLAVKIDARGVSDE